MGRILETVVLTFIAASVAGATALAVDGPQAASPGAKTDRISACSLVSRAEVKKLLPWAPHVDQVANQEDPIGTTGSSCAYPTVHVQVMPFSQRMIDTARKNGKLEPVSGVGDEAHFHDNRNRYAELYVKAGKHLLTLQANVPVGKTSDSVKPAVVALAKAFVEKLR
jgi:hypothetical protein